MLGFLSMLGQRGDGWYDHMAGWDGGWMWFWGMLMMLGWVVIIAMAVWLVQRSQDSRRSTSGRAREILDERYARGEIDAQEYRERLDHMS